MSSRPSYYYQLSIYDSETVSNNEKAVDLGPRGWYFPIGIGKHIVSFFDTTKAVGRNLTTKGSDLLDYASSLEGTVKIGFITSCTCVGGILSLMIRPKSRIQKLFYPSLFLTTSSAICYPSTAYIVSKTGLVYAYNGGETIYDGTKFVFSKISEWSSARKLMNHERQSGEERPEIIPLERKMEEVSGPESAPIDIAPLKNPPLSDYEDAGKDSQESKSSDTSTDNVDGSDVDQQTPSDKETFIKMDASVEGGPQTNIAKIESSVEDLGQSSAEDKELYTTRS